MRTFTKRTVVLLAAGTFTLASLGVLATQSTRTGMWNYHMGNSMDSRYDKQNVNMSSHKWSAGWRDWVYDSDMMSDRYMMNADCRDEMYDHGYRGLNNTLPTVDQDQGNTGNLSSSVTLMGDDQRQYGRSLVADIGCQGCHQIGNDGGRFGPSLNNVVSRQGEDFVHSKLEDPGFDTNNSRMPNFDLSNEEISAIVAYLTTLDGD